MHYYYQKILTDVELISSFALHKKKEKGVDSIGKKNIMNFNDKEQATVAIPLDDDLSDGSDVSANGIFQENEVAELNDSFTKFQRSRYQCGICAKIVTDRRLGIHHDRKHPSVPYSPDIYELYEINERAKCNLCNQQMDPHNMLRHQRLKHPPYSQNNVQSNNDVQEMFPIAPHPYQMTFHDPYSPLVSPPLLQSDIPEQAENMNQHYVNVFVSNAEYQRLAFEGRVYSNENGQIFITDSM